MAIGLGTAALIGVGASALSAGGQAFMAGKMNKRAVNFQREMFDKQGQRELEYWHLQNKYNLPAEQMKRLQDAGLNPNLVYNNGADAQSATLKAGGAPSMPSQMSEAIDFSSIAQTALATKQIEANINKTQAEADRLRQDTAIGRFDLEAREALGQSTFTKQLAAKVQNLTMQDEKQIVEYRNWLGAMYDGENLTFNFDVDNLGHLPSFMSPKLQEQYNALTQKVVEEVKNIKSGIGLRDSQLGIQELEKVMKQAEADFTRSFGSKTGAGMVIQLLRLIFGR